MSERLQIVVPGDRFGRWTVQDFDSTPQGERLCRVRCDCGTERVVRLATLKNGTSRSCGCLGRELRIARLSTHGLSHTAPEYRIWAAMKARCLNPNCRAFARYGGRGITVCGRWRESFEAFLADLGRRPSAKHTLERRDNDGPYSPENCYWATRAEQARNRSDNHTLTLEGRTQTITDWAEEVGISVTAIRTRIERGWDVRRAITAPSRRPYAQGGRAASHAK